MQRSQINCNFCNVVTDRNVCLMKNKFCLLTFFFLFSFLTNSYAEDFQPTDTKIVAEQQTPSKLEVIRTSQIKKITSSMDLKEIFFASPIIYSSLFLLSMAAVVIWLYSLLTFRKSDILPKKFIDTLMKHLQAKEYNDALDICQSQNNLIGSIVASGITSRQHGPQVMVDTMKAEGKRATASFWQRLSLLNDIVMIAPMMGLLGTVIGMFYAFYDVNRSVESINSLFDGLGIAVGTTVLGLIVAIIAMVFSTTLKYRLVKTLSLVENEAVSMSNFISQEDKK